MLKRQKKPRNYLKLVDDECRIEVELKGREDFEVDGDGEDEAEGRVHPSHRGHLEVGLKKHFR